MNSSGNFESVHLSVMFRPQILWTPALRSTRDLATDYSDLLFVVGAICPLARAWIDQTSAVEVVLARRPADQSEVKAASKAAAGGSMAARRRTNDSASEAPSSRSIPASSHSIEIGPS